MSVWISRPGQPRVFCIRAALATLIAAGLAGCASEQAVWGPPAHTEVPAVAAEDFPTIGTAPAQGRKPLTAEQRAKLESDLDRLAKERARRAKQAADESN